MKKILFIATEHGSFNLIYPVLCACIRKHSVAYAGIRPISEEGLLFKKRLAPTKKAVLPDLGLFDTFITGSSEVSDLEREVWKYAAQFKKRSICLLDQHKELGRRFMQAGRCLAPDVICVVNSDSRNALIDFGIEKEKLVVTGSPYLARVASFRMTGAEKAAFKAGLNLGGRKVVTFCTEYIAKDNKRDEFGYDEHSILKDIIACLASQRPLGFRLYIRLHPNDDPRVYERYDGKRFGSVEIQVSRPDAGYEMLQVSDVVVGISSVILVEAAILGLPVISYQPAAGKKKFIFNTIVKKNLVTERDGLASRLRRLLSKDAKKAARYRCADEEAVEKILKYV